MIQCTQNKALRIISFKQVMQPFEPLYNQLKINSLKVVSATFLLVHFVSLKEGTCEIRKNLFYFTSKALFNLEIIKF